MSSGTLPKENKNVVSRRAAGISQHKLFKTGCPVILLMIPLHMATLSPCKITAFFLCDRVSLVAWLLNFIKLELYSSKLVFTKKKKLSLNDLKKMLFYLYTVSILLKQRSICDSNPDRTLHLFRILLHIVSSCTRTRLLLVSHWCQNILKNSLSGGSSVFIWSFHH